MPKAAKQKIQVVCRACGWHSQRSPKSLGIPCPTCGGVVAKTDWQDKTDRQLVISKRFQRT